MKVKEEFEVKNSAGKVISLDYLTPPLTYLDYGFAPLPRGFEGYCVKNSNIVVEKQADGTFKNSKTNEVYSRV